MSNHKSSDLQGTLKEELHQLETETLEIEDISEMGIEMADWCSSSCSTSSCCSCSTSTCCSCSTSTTNSCA